MKDEIYLPLAIAPFSYFCARLAADIISRHVCVLAAALGDYAVKILFERSAD